MNFSITDAHKYTIHDLRIIGRELGVKRPSMMRKHELIAAINDVYSGNVSPSFSTRGRPAKEALSVDDAKFFAERASVKKPLAETGELILTKEKLDMCKTLCNNFVNDLFDILYGSLK